VLVLIAIALTGLALAIAAGLGVLAAMDTINWIKPMVVGRIRDGLGRRVAIAGDLGIIWSLPPAFGADSVRLANVEGGGAGGHGYRGACLGDSRLGGIAGR
jgi:uncharacterized protein involved in outer membrane biogenesis